MLQNDNWVSLNSISAYGRDVYTTVAITLEDSTSAVNGLTTYRVIASMEEGIFVSAPQSGYSVDNIAPQVPNGVMLVANDDGLNISWDEIQDDDLSYYTNRKNVLEINNPELKIDTGTKKINECVEEVLAKLIELQIFK